MTKLDEFQTLSGARANRRLFEWLCDDQQRADLYRTLRSDKRVLKFQSCADINEGVSDNRASRFHQDVYLVSNWRDVEAALTSPDFTNAPYQRLGSGTFMLGLDPDNIDHAKQRAFALAYLRFEAPANTADVIAALADLAFQAGAILPLKQRAFDIVDMAEQVALRFAGFFFGFAQSDIALLETTMRKAYRGLNYQIIGRHFVSEPGAIDDAARAMGALLARVSELIDIYGGAIGREQHDELERLKVELDELKNASGQPRLGHFVPVLQRIAVGHGPAHSYSGTELAVIVVGLIAGMIGNVQASVSIAISEFFSSASRLSRAQELAKTAALGNLASTATLQSMIWEALRLNPPAAFLPRQTTTAVELGHEHIAKGAVLLLAIGGATRAESATTDRFDSAAAPNGTPIVFGGRDDPAHIHQCVGQHIAMPLITHIVGRTLCLEGLSQSLDPRSGNPLGLQKLWGIICQSYPLEYDRQSFLSQSPLNVIMTVKSPVAEHAEKLKLVIKYGAPRIEKKLRDANHVHFASFLFLENDTKLALFTIFDRDFDSYIEHFALRVGPLFDKIFEHIENAPPLPVNKFPKEFVDTIRRFNVSPAGNYFFSAYPKTSVGTIVHDYVTNKKS